MNGPVTERVCPRPGSEFHRPRNLGELFDLLDDAPADALMLAGGMTAMPYLNRGEWTTSCIISLTKLPELAGIRVTPSALVLAAAATHTEVATSEDVRMHCPALADAAASIGDRQVRNRGTVGGVVAFANLGADYLTVLTAVDAVVVLESRQGSRRLPVRDFVVGYRATLLESGEVIAAIEITLDRSRRERFLRLTRVQGAPPVITVAAVQGDTSMALCVGGATARPVLFGEEVFRADDAGVRMLVLDAIEHPLGDGMSPAPYRRAMAAEYAVRVLELLRADPVRPSEEAS